MTLTQTKGTVYQQFPVSIRNKQQLIIQIIVDKKSGKKTSVQQHQQPYVKVAMNGTIPLPRDAARSFKQQWQAGAVTPRLVAKAGTGELQRVALVNDSGGAVLECQAGRCMTERERLIYTDLQTGLQWLRDGNFAGKRMNWTEAMAWVQTGRAP